MCVLRLILRNKNGQFMLRNMDFGDLLGEV